MTESDSDELTMADALALFKYVATDLADGINLSAADFSTNQGIENDDKITMLDEVLLLLDLKSKA